MPPSPRVDEFIRRLREAAPELDEEDVENIRRAAYGLPPAHGARPMRSPQRTDRH